MNNSLKKPPVKKADLGRILAIDNLHLDIRYAYPDDLIPILDDIPEVHRAKNGGDGLIWVNGKKLQRRRAMALRPFFADPFGWGCDGENAKVTALELCLKIFYNQKTALKLYTPFLHSFVKDWYGYAGNVKIDITDFLLDNYYRCSEELLNYYYIDTKRNIHEVDIWQHHNGSTSCIVEGEEMEGESLKAIKEKISLKLARHILHT
ncbi:DUF6166 domain-containing protein [Chitinophaga sp. XS-30]|uniref:DUF6166 domain-containing protein n=1 Tax=Chitinophaga sp. XS-30 TaxID=2604421 RepID=UPI0011DD15A7|nr:DUF6166 domain-containing protein [Chitinophaga sp. XS-30]QEH39460.1 hypothetical protein FW415_00655 [Chitinophaga sp. XS-30]